MSENIDQSGWLDIFKNADKLKPRALYLLGGLILGVLWSEYCTNPFRTYHTGMRGGCYYNAGSKRVYVDASFCQKTEAAPIDNEPPRANPWN